jgi:hypothetical protein
LEILEGMRRREPLRYPFRMPDGTRRELPVRWLCPECTERAIELRPAEPVGADEEDRRLSHVIDMTTLGEGYLLEAVLVACEGGEEHAEHVELDLQEFARELGEGDIHWVRAGGVARFYTHSRVLRNAWADRDDD